ncbi:type II secretion system F family protein [Streptomyces sp. P9(2023)]|uniref:type II secretion system F family protein n=1 Tax=Streptomyces sp. P9(2023) TaxID=3064394 RepID=UPI0028F4341F|nr:type II secretion system F family protein [Streptomyces sp. P9(2023)]MDT9689427.1 type II secretion system F family protein [Streptomyces sp. P9(2023)]
MSDQAALAQGAAVLCAGAALWRVAERERGVRRARLVLAGVGGPGDPGAPGRARTAWRAVGERWWAALRGRRAWLCLPVAAVLAVLGESPLPLVAGALAGPLVGRRLRAAALRREREARSDAVVGLCGAVAAELRAGRQPARALLFAVGATGALGPKEEAEVLAAARFGGDVAAALRRAARQDGADALAGLAACWQVAVDGGAGLAAGLDRLEAALREHRDQRERLRAQLAGAWATVAVLAVLPAVGLLLGSALGARPLYVLLHTPLGLGCLVVGAALETAGLWWAARIVRGGERV